MLHRIGWSTLWLVLALPVLSACSNLGLLPWPNESSDPPSIEIVQGATATLPLQSTLQLTATVTGATRTALAWSSSDPTVATIDGDGVVTPIATGSTTIRASLLANPSRFAEIAVTIVEAASLGSVNGVTLTQGDAVRVTLDATVQLVAVVDVTGEASQDVTWSSTNESVATVDATGLVTPVSVGTTVVKATSVADSSKAAQTTVTVEVTPVVQSVTIDQGDAATLEVGGTLTLEATVDVQGDAETTVTWSSSDASVATVDAAGLVTAEAVGSATITATSTFDPSKTDALVLTVNAAAPQLMALDTGETHTLAVATTGDGWAWGDGTNGRLGDGEASSRMAPVTVNMPSGVRFTQVAAGIRHSVALAADGAAWAWGYAFYGALGDGGDPQTDRSEPVRVAMPDGVSFTDVAAGSETSYAIDTLGQAWAWGWNHIGQLGIDSTVSQPTPVAVDMPIGVSFTDVVAGTGFVVALDASGRAWSWGSDGKGQLGDGDALSTKRVPVAVEMPLGITFTSISAGANHVLAVDQYGNAWAWGDDQNGQLGDGGSRTNRGTPGPVTMPLGVSFTDVAAGSFHSVALDGNGNAWAWGNDVFGQLGHGDFGSDQNHETPTAVTMPPDTSFTHVVAGYGHSLALDATGAAWGWGNDLSSQLGDGAFVTNVTTPVRAAMPTSP